MLETYGHPIFKWLHVIAGIVWIGLLYFFNFINGHVAATLDGESKKKVVPELMPRTLYWFRWGAAWTWVTGILLLYIIFWQGNLSIGDDSGSTLIDAGNSATMFTHIMLSITFLSVFIYDFFYKSSIAKNVRLATIISYAYVGLMVYLYTCYANMGYRGVNIHLGAMFGTMMAFNVWFRIWPAQQQIITAVKDGNAPDGNLVALAGLRSKHNTYMSVPLIWTMINQHTTAFESISIFGTTIVGKYWLMFFVALGWHIVFQLYKKSAKIKGF